MQVKRACDRTGVPPPPLSSTLAMTSALKALTSCWDFQADQLLEVDFIQRIDADNYFASFLAAEPGGAGMCRQPPPEPSSQSFRVLP